MYIKITLYIPNIQDNEEFNILFITTIYIY